MTACPSIASSRGGVSGLLPVLAPLGSHFSKAGEYALQMESGKLVFRIASNSGGGSWDKEVEVSLGSASGWRHALFWIVPGVEGSRHGAI